MKLNKSYLLTTNKLNPKTGEKKDEQTHHINVRSSKLICGK